MGSLQKSHAVMIPFPAQGHVNPFMQLAKLLHSRGFCITFVNNEFNHQRLLHSKGPDFVNSLPDFRFESIPDSMPESDLNATQDIAGLCYSARHCMIDPFRELIAKLSSAREVPPVSCIISDGIMGFAIEVAAELGIPHAQFQTTAAAGFLGFYHLEELMRRGMVPFKDENFEKDGTLETPIDWIPGLRNTRLRDIPTFIRVTDPDDISLNAFSAQAQNCIKAAAIIFNSFEELEEEALDAVRAITNQRNIYTVGPLPLLETQLPQTQVSTFRPNLWKDDSKCFDWLDKKEPSSVVYVNFGSIATMSEQHFKEFAWGLANSKHQFLWIARGDMVKGKTVTFTEEYYQEIKDRGLIISWCPQYKVLSHPSIGCFLTHAGWNSTLESLTLGLPVLCWPYFCEQVTDCRYLCTVWGTGMEINPDVKRDELTGLIREVIEGEKGKEMKKNALKWKKKAEEALEIGGSSYNNLDKFIKEVMLHGC